VVTDATPPPSFQFIQTTEFTKKNNVKIEETTCQYTRCMDPRFVATPANEEIGNSLHIRWLNSYNGHGED
jgi:hypothetical protein